MNPGQRVAYLRALGVEAWVPKTAVAASPSRAAVEHADVGSPAGNETAPFGAAAAFFVEPGISDTLLLCDSQAEAGTVLARDISRSLKCEPVWGWPVPERSDRALTLEQAVRDRLITRLLVFGPGLACLDEDEGSGVIGTAEALRVASLPQLASSGKARRALWEALSARKWCAARARVFSLSSAAETEG